ncbi:hypothetical protein HHI36_004751, partial [Cryptolaemus montrouzieri]
MQNGALQGSVLSVTQFLITMNEILGLIKKPISATMFADDLSIGVYGMNLNTLQIILQECLSNLENFLNINQLKISETKFVITLFKKLNSNALPGLNIKNTLLNNTDE